MKFPKFSHSRRSNVVWITGAAVAGMIVVAASSVPVLSDEEIVDAAGNDCHSLVMGELGKDAVLGGFQRGERDGTYVIQGEFVILPEIGDNTHGEYECVWSFDTSDDGSLEVFIDGSPVTS